MTRKRQIVTALAIVAILVICAASVVIYFVTSSDWPGGMRPSYAAVDYDARLTQEAKGAMPIAIAVKKYFASNHSYPKDLSFLSGASPTTSPATPNGGVNGWKYFPDAGGAGFVLYKRLGWDPSLQYTWDGTAESWLFDPGDGSPQKNVVLKP